MDSENSPLLVNAEANDDSKDDEKEKEKEIQHARSPSKPKGYHHTRYASSIIHLPSPRYLAGVEKSFVEKQMEQIQLQKKYSKKQKPTKAPKKVNYQSTVAKPIQTNITINHEKPNSTRFRHQCTHFSFVCVSYCVFFVPFCFVCFVCVFLQT